MTCKNCKCDKCEDKRNNKVLSDKKKLLLTGNKRCTKCKEILDIEKFNISNKKNGTRRGDCKDCRKIRNRNYHKNITVKKKKDVTLKQKERDEIVKGVVSDYLENLTDSTTK